MKKVISALLVIALLMTAVACGNKPAAPATDAPAAAAPAADGEKSEHIRTLKYSSTVASSAYNDTAIDTGTWEKYFIEQLPIRTNGRYDVELYLDSQLAGTVTENVGGMQNGAFDIIAQAVGNYGEYTTAFAEMNMPFLVNNHVLAYNLVTSEIGDRMSAQCEADIPNSKVLGYSTIGIRQMTNKDKPFYSPADLKGVKIRTMNDRVQVATFQAMGASVTSVSYSELFTALQQGVVDAQE